MISEQLPHWDLSNVYPGLDSEAFKRDVEKLVEEIGQFKALLSRNEAETAADLEGQVLAGYIGELVDQYNAILLLAGTLSSYIYSFVSTDSYNNQAKRSMSQYDSVWAQFEKQQVRFDKLAGSISNRLEKVADLNQVAREHRFALKEAAEQSQYLMSEREESLAADLKLSGASAWNKLQGTLTSQIKVDFDLEGETRSLPAPSLINLRTHPDEEVRKRAYFTELEVWKQHEEPLAAALNGVKGSVTTLDRRRGRQDALHSALDAARIDRQTLEVMLAAMRASFPSFREYFRAKAGRFGKGRLPWWDLFAPSGVNRRDFGFESARDFILDNFGKFSPDLESFAKKAFQNRWIDAEPRPGKRGGAFCMPVPGVQESRVLCNFDGSLDQVFTIAHELGHGYHNYCAFHAGKTGLQRKTPMTLAETASIMCETIVTEAILAQTDDPAEELGILETSLISDAQVIVDIYSRYLFEKEVFERRAQAELSAQEFCEIMHQAQVDTYGDGLDEKYLHPYMWTWKPHYYRPGLSFYNFPYAFGLLFGIGLYSIYQERGDAFVPQYQDLLASTGEDKAAELASRFGIDIQEQSFWDDSLQVIQTRIERYKQL
jgi:pepF/M3 family oligoendopeptidase